jgi:hypothetical protein
MTLHELENILSKYENQLTKQLKDELSEIVKLSVEAYPFNEYELRLTFLQEHNIISFISYGEIRKKYISSNIFLDLYGLAPRVFGQVWGETHIVDKNKRFNKAHKSLDPNYSGEYDIWLEGIKIEVKASRAINKKIRGSLISKALEFESTKTFWMNFQQLKFDICDIFIFIGVWTDIIKYWVLTNEEVKSNPYISHQHRGGVEYQIGVTEKNISKFDKYLVDSKRLLEVIIEKYKSSND